MSEKVREIEFKDFRKEVLEAEVPVVVDFWAPWCAPCRFISPAIEEVAVRYGDRIKVVKINADQNGQLVKGLQVIGIPTIMLLNQRKEVARYVGENFNVEELQKDLEPLLAAQNT